MVLLAIILNTYSGNKSRYNIKKLQKLVNNFLYEYIFSNSDHNIRNIILWFLFFCNQILVPKKLNATILR